MERIIKFRGKRVDNGEWVYGDYAKGERSHYIIQRSWVEIDPATLGQFTGLQDKNGKEIYEGDVVRLQSNTFLIFYQNGGFKAKVIGDPKNLRRAKIVGCGTFAKLTEILGSIHSNPELLQQ